MADRLSLEERDWLLAGLRGLVSCCGAERLSTGRILEPTPRDFPDPFEPDEACVGQLLRRILGYAGLDALRVDLETFRQPDEVHELDAWGEAARWGHDGTAAWFAGIEQGRCRFGVAVERISEPETLVATLCHEVAHAWRRVHGRATSYLSPEAMSFLLAAQARARGLGWFACKRIARMLEPNQASHFRWALRTLGDRKALRRELGLAGALV